MTVKGRAREKSRMPMLESWYYRGAVLHEIKVEEICTSLKDVEGGLACRGIRDGKGELRSRRCRTNRGNNGLYPMGWEGLKGCAMFS